jgi:DNA polymerase III alpha subunit
MVRQPEFKKGSVELLIKAGCFDGFIPLENFFLEKAVLLHNAEQYVSQLEKHEKERKSGQMGLFGDAQNNGFEIHIQRNVKPLTLQEEFQNEVALFGFYLSGKLFNHYSTQFGKVSCCNSDLISRMKPGTGILLCGFINEVIVKTGSNNKLYAIMTLDNGADNFRFYLFSEKYEQFKNYLVLNNFVMLRVSLVEGKKGIQSEITSIKPIDSLPAERFSLLHICLEGEEASPEIKESLSKIKEIVDNPKNQGTIQMVFHIISSKDCHSIYVSDKFRLAYSSGLVKQIEALPNLKGFWLF